MIKKHTIPYDLDDPGTTLAHRDIILKNLFLNKIYRRWYGIFMTGTRHIKPGKHLEIGSGGGFYKDLFPEVITSDILSLPGIDQVFSAEQMPFSCGELASIVMLNVFHHIPRPWLFLREAERTLQKGGKMMMIEPANSAFEIGRAHV